LKVNFRAIEKKDGLYRIKLSHMFKTFPSQPFNHVYAPVNKTDQVKLLGWAGPW